MCHKIMRKPEIIGNTVNVLNYFALRDKNENKVLCNNENFNEMSKYDKKNRLLLKYCDIEKI